MRYVRKRMAVARRRLCMRVRRARITVWGAACGSSARVAVARCCTGPKDYTRGALHLAQWILCGGRDHLPGVPPGRRLGAGAAAVRRVRGPIRRPRRDKRPQ